jgi:Uncharacterised nucleotidyltransferase
MAAAAEIRPLPPQAPPANSDDPEFNLLLACCAHEEQANGIAEILSCPLDWERLLTLIDHHRIVPQAYGRLSAHSYLIPAPALDVLRSRYHANARKTLWFTSELLRVVDHLDAAGIRALPYKGPTLAQALYGAVTERQFGDLDILVDPTDVPKAKAALRELGYQPGIDLAPREEQAYIETGYEYSFKAMNGQSLLELQWQITPRFYSIDFDVRDFLDRAEESSFGGTKNSGSVDNNRILDSSREAAKQCSPRRKPWVESETPSSPSGAKDRERNCFTRTLRSEDLLLVLCVHAAKHVWVQLSWLCDIAQLVTSQPLNWNAIQDEACRLGIERILHVNLLLSHKLLRTPLPFIIQQNPTTTALADEVLSIIQRSTYYNTESIPYFRLMIRLRERRRDQARFLWRLASTPSLSEWSTIRLPKPLHPLYRLVRLSRLAKRLAD